ncbi:Phytanoyl-CoA dioxygenase [Gammaproteobacteria bacterium]
MGSIISAEQSKKFHEEGYFVLEGALDKGLVELGRQCCDLGLAALGDRARQVRDGTPQAERLHPNFVKLPHQAYPALDRFIFASILRDICRTTLGDEAYLYYDQFVVKQARVGGPLSWHQDSDYVGFPHKPYVNCWCPLDDVNEENGTVWMLTYERAGTRALRPVPWDSEGRSTFRINDPGTPIVARAGSILVFSSLIIHRSGPNTTDWPRRAYTIQFSPEPILLPKTSQPQWLARPILKGGLPVMPEGT